MRKAQDYAAFTVTSAFFCLAMLGSPALTSAALITNTLGPTDFSPPPSGRGSSLAGGIRDATLADLFGLALMKNGVSNVKQATFLFQECYGGGMLGALTDKFANSINWVGGSASKYNQYSIGQPSIQENKILGEPPAFESDDPMNFWTRALEPWLSRRDIPVFRALNEAAFHDPVGISTQSPFDKLLPMKVRTPFGLANVGPEHGQVTASSPVQDFTLACPTCKQHFAILWAGQSNRLRYYNDVSSIRATLTSLWGDPALDPNVHIAVFFGDGATKVSGPGVAAMPPNNLLPADWHARPAQSRLLQAYVKTTLLNNLGPDDDFFFYASDHGSWYVKDSVSRAIPANGVVNEVFTVDEEALGGMFVEGINIPTLSIDYAQLLASIPVSFNGYPLGELGAASGATTRMFPVPENLIGFTNEVQIGGAAHSGFFLSGLTFDTGDIGTDPVPAVPEPPTLLLLGLGFAALLSGMRVCSRAQQSKNYATQVCSYHLRHKNLNSGLFPE